MDIDYKWALNLSVVCPKAEGTGWYYYSVLEGLAEKLSMPNPYRNPDKTFSRLIYEEARSYLKRD